jgi:hypothetical protein
MVRIGPRLPLSRIAYSCEAIAGGGQAHQYPF